MTLIDVLLVLPREQKIKIVLRSCALCDKYIGIVKEFNALAEKYIINKSVFRIETIENDVLKICIV